MERECGNTSVCGCYGGVWASGGSYTNTADEEKKERKTTNASRVEMHIHTQRQKHLAGWKMY